MARTNKARRSVKVVLTEQETLEYARSMSRSNESKIKAETSLASLSAQIKGNIKVFDSEIQRFSRLVSDGFEYRDMDCQIHYDWDSGVKLILRPDNGDVVEEAIITEAEKQEDALEQQKESEEKAKQEEDVDKAEPSTTDKKKSSKKLRDVEVIEPADNVDIN